MKSIFSILLVSLFISAPALAQVELWGKTGGGTGDDEADKLCLDASGNLYVSGFFKSPSVSLADRVLKNNGTNSSDIFIAKYDPSGKLLWAKSAGGAGDEEVLGMFMDPTGNVCIRGYFESKSVAFDGVKLSNNTDDISMFLVKYDQFGKVLWGTSAEVLGSSHATDGQGNIFISGELFAGTKTDFGNGAFTQETEGIFVAKYNTDGKIQWIKKGTGADASSISADGFGNVYVTGLITGAEHSMETGQKIINSGPERTTDMFLTKLSSEGKIMWQKTIGGKGNEEPRGEYVNASGNVYIVMRYTSISLNLGKEAYKNGGGDDLLLIKYDPNGNILWSKNAGGSGHDNPIFLECDAAENIYLVGHYYSNQITFDHLTLTNVGLNDIFIVKFASDSKVQWAKTTGGNHHDYPNGLVVDAAGNSYLIGEFNNSANKDKIISEFFMEKYDPAGNSVWKNTDHRSETFDFAFGESIDKLGNLYMVGYFGGNLKFAGTDFKSLGSKDLFILKYNVNKEAKATVAPKTPAGKTAVSKTAKKK